ncbi:nicotinate-nucleotide--dimethylbenzimidazole phosphoribosyltransferase [Alteromonas sp. RKMC-009]|uniref:nicotinate-nucleotide--dimethylbenzimidazole phosphoribosyltransferase n=1 Tax=Alteromonas sp. RKMC-009 TaxID=2267264 RepID=UPI000E678D20|nr:nicotinate-nucleotide--dimethylbenzimidazole phosphoribosyltransferase [Alteromonas sp. RKMC-009]AYA63242.1 nicotinate-nucleotide--dimethylbenzimidazole phosphoribosyltransferase [Alteromonas sp. RKMC-009]MEC7689401.1 nicotinate-nucleotide--dimethylbenzimidazole phosphoribosyltransferase [Pseudomonadota bacterium]
MSIFESTFWSVPPLNREPEPLIRGHIDGKTKPPGALGQLESLALQLALMQWQGTIQPVYITQPAMLVFAADHGIAAHNISIAPQTVTQQMVLNFLNGGAAINAFCATNGLALKVIDCGMIKALPVSHEDYIVKRVASGSHDISRQPAMSDMEAELAILHGADVAKCITGKGCNVVGFGEMGIGNTSVAAALISALTGEPVRNLTGKGTGINDSQLTVKQNLLEQAMARTETACGNLPVSPEQALVHTGGFEIGQIAGAMLATAQAGKLILVDGFIVSAAALLATKIAPEVRDYMVFCHCSAERGHKFVLEQLNATPLLDLGLRLGEGTGAALSLPLLKAAASFYNDMASFESAKVVL